MIPGFLYNIYFEILLAYLSFILNAFKTVSAITFFRAFISVSSTVLYLTFTLYPRTVCSLAAC